MHRKHPEAEMTPGRLEQEEGCEAGVFVWVFVFPFLFNSFKSSGGGLPPRNGQEKYMSLACPPPVMSQG